MPAFHAILVLRDEGDIIAQTLEHLLTWCDTILIYDTGSLDDTWNIVQDAAARERRIIPIASQPVFFAEGLRAWVFNQHRHRFRDGDWIARVDADEFYHLAPPPFIRDHLSRAEGRIYAQLYEFEITLAEFRAWQRGDETIADRARPMERRRRHFWFEDFPELRLFRYRRSMRWYPDGFGPCHGGLIAVSRIPVRHYRARDPVQVQRRCIIRAVMSELNSGLAQHWQGADWRRFIVNEDDAHIHKWKEGEPLPHRELRNHLTPAHPRPGSERVFRIERAIRRFTPALPRLAQHILYRTPLVRLRDRLRPPPDPGFAPTPLPPEAQERLRRYMDAIVERPRLVDPPLHLVERSGPAALPSAS